MGENRNVPLHTLFETSTLSQHILLYIQMDSSEKMPHILMVNHHVLHQNCHQWVNHYPCNVWWWKCHDCSQHPRYLGRLRKLEDKMTKLPCMWLSLYPELVEANLILIGLSAIYPVSPRFFPTHIFFFGRGTQLQRSSGLALKFWNVLDRPWTILPQNQALCNHPGCLDPLQRSERGSDGRSVHPLSLLR